MWHRFHRRELRPVRAPEAPLDDRLAGGGPAPDEVAVARETLRTVQEALADLPDRERAAVLLRSLGLGLDDVAASLGVSARRARKLSDSGHRRLAHELEAASAGERCAGVASTLRALSLGWEIGGRRRTRLERHLATCPACRATVAALRREGRLAALPVVLAETPTEGLVERAAQAAARAWDRAPAGSAEASVGALGGALATKVVAGCVAAGVVAGCVAIATGDDPAPAPAPARPAAQSAPTAPTSVAPPKGARTRNVSARPTERVRRARSRAREAARSVRRAQRRTAQAVQRTREAQRQVQRAQVRTQQAQEQTQQAQVKTQQAQQRIAEAQANVERATTSVDEALEKAFGGAP
jgi:hypothetical protein